MADVLFLCFFFLFLISPSFQNVSESEPLVRFKNSVNVTLGDLSSWRIGTDPCDGKWLGVYCQNGQTVSGIHIPGIGLSGNINIDDLAALPELKTVRLDNNFLSGALPDFYRLSGLRSLLISNNSFTGEIPDDFFKDTLNLKRLFFDHNQFFGKIPKSVMQLPYLEELHLQDNKFSGEIPPLTDTNQDFKILDVSNNNLEGKVPESFTNRKDIVLKYEGNYKSCGDVDRMNRTCEAVYIDQTIILPPTKQNTFNSPTVYTIIASAVILFVFVIVVGILNIVNGKNKSEFRTLGKRKMSNNDILEVNVPESATELTSMNSSRSGGSAPGGSTNSRGGGGIVGDLIMVNTDKGSFGFPDLMNAIAEVLGNGSLGSAYKVEMTNGLTVAVKRVKDMNILAPELFDIEMRRLGQLSHPNVLTPLAYHYGRDEKLVVSQYMPKSSLMYALHGDREIYRSDLTWSRRLKIIQGAARGMQYLHEAFVSYELPHGNLKSSNVLLNESYEPMISDYAFLPLLQPNSAARTLFAFKTPEFAYSHEVSKKSDVYCFGVIVLEIVTGKFPSQYLNYGEGGTDIVQWVHSSIVVRREEQLIDPEIINDTDTMLQMVELLRIAAACTASNPDERLDMREALRRIEEVY